MRPTLLWLALALPLSAAPPAEGGDLPFAFARWALADAADEGVPTVGEPLVLVLEVEHPAGAAVALQTDPEQPLFEFPWLLLEELPLEKRRLVPEPGVPRTGAPETGAPDGRATGEPRIDSLTRYAWRVTRLAPGEAWLPTLDLVVGDEFLTADSLALDFASALGPEENRPRPPAGFHEPEFTAATPFFTPLRGALLFAAAGLVALVLGMRALMRRKRALASAPPRPGVQLAAIEPELAAGGAASRQAHYELTRLLRAVVDERVGRSRPAATDAEWLAELRAGPGVDAATLESCALVLERARDVKYGGQDVTRWAAEETLAAARTVIEPDAPERPSRNQSGSAA